MRKRIIAIDCDDVIIATAPAIVAHYNKAYGTNLELKDAYSRDLSVWGVADDETAVQRVEAYLSTDEYQSIEPFKEAIEMLREIGTYHELHIVTGRSDIFTKSTKDMLQKYFPDIFTSVEFTNFFGKNPRSKADVCRQLGADLLIDDHLHHAEVVATECGIEVMLFGSYPWNQTGHLPANITRVSGWPEIAAKLLP